VDPINEMMESLGDMFSFFVLDHADGLAHRLEVMTKEDKRKSFIKSFLVIAGYSSQPGRSKRLVRALLSVLNVNTVNRLKWKLRERQRVMKDITPEKLRNFTNSALKCV